MLWFVDFPIFSMAFKWNRSLLKQMGAVAIDRFQGFAPKVFDRLRPMAATVPWLTRRLEVVGSDGCGQHSGCLVLGFFHPRNLTASGLDL